MHVCVCVKLIAYILVNTQKVWMISQYFIHKIE